MLTLAVLSEKVEQEDTLTRLRQMTTGLCSLAPVSEVQHLTDRFQTVVRPETEMVNGDELSPSLLIST